MFKMAREILECYNFPSFLIEDSYATDYGGAAWSSAG